MQLLINVLKIYFESNANGCQGKVLNKSVFLLSSATIITSYHTKNGAKEFQWETYVS